MTVELIAYTQMPGFPGNPMAVVEQAASVCYDSRPTETYRIANTCKASGHTSVLEHISFTFHISCVSRALLAQLTRHRHASFSVRSQRYCSEWGFKHVTPKSVKVMGMEDAFENRMSEINCAYRWLQDEEVPSEDARYVLPNACCTELYMTMNARALIESSRQRLCSRAQWEIRGMFEAMREAVRPVCPEVADWMRPKCEDDPKHPFCPESKGCGRHPKLEEVYKK
ncbi:FAD-dependent thymidylate synthase [Fournierella massiliensis]|nr:FAD-dependent thymidylate synthase [Fournierella massiliensis]MCF2557582.1 FAD-dependent thymidylate synthase [Fournierella massiliensis]